VFSFLSVLNLGFRLDVVLLVFLNLKVPFPSGAPAPPVLCWPQTFKELSLFLFSSFNPSFQVEKDCKVTTFLYSGNQNFQLFLIKYCSYLLISKIKFSII
ncbi:MAG: hypothetical protein IKH61_05165, partial [Bacteroidales bacterium]|nr:hypothetical protein [Bacteroidales bacterium]